MNMALIPAKIGQADIEPLSAEEIVLLQGDLSVLSAAQRVKYYQVMCASVGLNPLTKPFDYIVLNGKLTLYAKKDATDQLRTIHVISVDKLERSMIPDMDILTVTAYGHNIRGRTDASIGAVSIRGLSGEAMANAMMKAETKAKRRLTLSLAGLGFLDENEVSAIVGAQIVHVDDEGEIDKAPPPAEPPKSLAEALDRREEPPVESPGSAPVAPSLPDEPKEAPEPAAPLESAPEAEAPEPVATTDGDYEPSGLSWDEFKRMIKEKHVLTGAVVAAANKLWPEPPGITAADLPGLSDEARFALYLAVTVDN